MRRIRRAHVTVAAVFDSPPLQAWDRFTDFDTVAAGPDEAVVLRPGRARWIRDPGDGVGVVEELVRAGSGRVVYRARRPGGSATDDVDAVVRISQHGEGSLVTWSAEFLPDNDVGAGREDLRNTFAERLRAAGGTVRTPLRMEVYQGRYTPLARVDADRARATWSATTATLVSGERDAILVDALMTVDEATDLVAWIRSTGKRLTTVVVTQGQADHFFGLSTVLRAFPGAVAVAVPSVAERAAEQLDAGVVARWDSLFPGQLPTTVGRPGAHRGVALDVEGHEVLLFDLDSLADRPGSIVSVRDLDAVIGGDLVYNGIHPWLIGTDVAERARWRRTLDLVEALRPSWAIASHRDPGAVSDDATAQVRFMRDYLADFDRAVGSGRDPAAVVAAVLERHPALGNVSTLHASAIAQFPGWRSGLVRPDFPDLLRPEDLD